MRICCTTRDAWVQKKQFFLETLCHSSKKTPPIQPVASLVTLPVVASTGIGCGQHSEGTPLHQTCCNNGRLKVCAVNGDRATCARMASMGVLPGSELELLCKGGGQQCMVKVNGGTISLDMLTAATILVAPL